MPLYEYVCRSCDKHFEKLVRRFGEEVACPSCESGAVDKQLSVFAVASTAGAASFEGCGGGPCGEGACEAGPCAGGGCPYPN